MSRVLCPHHELRRLSPALLDPELRTSDGRLSESTLAKLIGSGLSSLKKLTVVFNPSVSTLAAAGVPRNALQKFKVLPSHLTRLQLARCRPGEVIDVILPCLASESCAIVLLHIGIVSDVIITEEARRSMNMDAVVAYLHDVGVGKKKPFVLPTLKEVVLLSFTISSASLFSIITTRGLAEAVEDGVISDLRARSTAPSSSNAVSSWARAGGSPVIQWILPTYVHADRPATNA